MKYEMYFFKVGHSYTQKNKLYEAFFGYVKALDGTLLQTKETKKTFIYGLRKRLQDFHAEHPRCKQIQLEQLEGLEKENLQLYVSGSFSASIYKVKHMQMKTKIYIAGKVSGLPIADVTIKFGNAQKELEAQGFEAINPLAVVNDWHMPWEQAMKKCLKALIDADGVLLLPCYLDSRGALIEMKLAADLNIRTFIGHANLHKRISPEKTLIK